MSEEWINLLEDGDVVVWGPAAAQPQALTRNLAGSDISVLTGMLLGSAITPQSHPNLRLKAFGAQGGLRAFARDGRLEIIPSSQREVGRLLGSGDIRADVVLVQVSKPDAHGRFSLGVCGDYLPAAIAAARVVVAQINSAMPYTYGDTVLDPTAIDAFVSLDEPLLEVEQGTPDEVATEIGRHVATLVRDGDTIEVGIGALSTAICRALSSHERLGVHTGVMGDAMMELILAGVVTNGDKGLDEGLSVTSSVLGSQALYRWADGNRHLAVRSSEYVHDPAVLSTIKNFCAINSAIEVSLSGEVNSESTGGEMLGGVGGLPDFVRAAMANPRGRSIIALPSTSGRGNSRIVPDLSMAAVTLPRCDADYVITEWGTAALRGLSIRERAEALCAIAHPRFREGLRAQAIGR